jgi:Na+/H+ antiporter NhaD/arsenite permease-like protein
MIPLWAALPFAGLLLCIAILPLAAPHFWKSNRNKAVVAGLLAVPVLFFLFQKEPQAISRTVFEYVSFIGLLGSLFIISGGIAVTGDLQGTPKVNTAFLAIGALLANVIGTTGASMVLIRPFLKTNSERKKSKHLPVFFIFIVSNCAGLLTPLGDPPLFLGFLRGVPFFWTLRLFPIWGLAIGLLLAGFYLWDRLAHRHEEPKTGRSLHSGRIKLIFGKAAFRHNRFHWSPLVEVAVLFAGIFVTMVPALMLLEQKGGGLGVIHPWQFFWLTGSLSSLLDNAPTYLTFLSLAQSLHLSPDVAGVPTKILEGISVGAVFMGANSYIGNGPNFMVKAIADHAGFKTPSFFGYMAYAFVVLFPLYGIIHFCFFR